VATPPRRGRGPRAAPLVRAEQPVSLPIAIQLDPPALIQAAWRATPALRGGPLAIAAPGGGGRILAACPHASADGVTIGHTIAQGRLRCLALALAPPDATAARALYEDLLHILSTLSPLVEATDPTRGHATLDARGLASLWGAREEDWDGAPVARAAVAALARHGLRARAACGPTRLAAHLLCYHAPDGALTLSPADKDRALRSVALTAPALGLDAATTRALDEVGVATVGALLDLPAAAVADRFGPALRATCRHLTGPDDRPLTRWTPPPCHEVARRLDGVDDGAVVDAVLRDLCARLHARLQADGLAAATLTVRLLCEDGACRTGQTRCWPPLQTAQSLAQAARTARAACPVTAPLAEIAVQASDLCPPETRQQGLFLDARDRRGERLAALAAAHQRRHGSPLFGRWRPDALSDDGWTWDAVERP